jgi:hypothetical protein
VKKIIVFILFSALLVQAKDKPRDWQEGKLIEFTFLRPDNHQQLRIRVGDKIYTALCLGAGTFCIEPKLMPDVGDTVQFAIDDSGGFGIRRMGIFVKDAKGKEQEFDLVGVSMIQ